MERHQGVARDRAAHLFAGDQIVKQHPVVRGRHRPLMPRFGLQEVHHLARRDAGIFVPQGPRPLVRHAPRKGLGHGKVAADVIAKALRRRGQKLRQNR